MEYQKTNLLDNTSNRRKKMSSKCRKKNWVETNGDALGT